MEQYFPHFTSLPPKPQFQSCKGRSSQGSWNSFALVHPAFWIIAEFWASEGGLIEMGSRVSSFWKHLNGTKMVAALVLFSLFQETSPISVRFVTNVSVARISWRCTCGLTLGWSLTSVSTATMQLLTAAASTSTNEFTPMSVRLNARSVLMRVATPAS